MAQTAQPAQMSPTTMCRLGGDILPTKLFLIGITRYLTFNWNREIIKYEYGGNKGGHCTLPSNNTNDTNGTKYVVPFGGRYSANTIPPFVWNWISHWEIVQQNPQSSNLEQTPPVVPFHISRIDVAPQYPFAARRWAILTGQPTASQQNSQTFLGPTQPDLDQLWHWSDL